MLLNRAFLDLDLDPRMPGMQKITSLLIKNVGGNDTSVYK